MELRQISKYGGYGNAVQKRYVGRCIVHSSDSCLCFFSSCSRPVSQIIAGYNAILKANPMPSGEKAQAIKITGDDMPTLFVARFAQGVEVKPHFHKTHSEIVYVIEGPYV